jgi:hypothetical protein
MSKFLFLSSLKKLFRRTKEPKGTKVRESVGGKGGLILYFRGFLLLP